MHLATPRIRNKGTVVVALSFVALASACSAVRLVSSYDEPTDRALTELQKTTDDFVTKMIANAPSDQNAWEKNRAFYDDIDGHIRQLEFRVGSVPKNDFTKKLVGNIRAVILGDGKCTAEGNSLRDLHCSPHNQAKGPSKTALEISQRNINQAINAALTLELAKKQGLEGEVKPP